MGEASDTVVQAAGGLVVRPGSTGAREVALIHRPRYDDWSLPKGKLLPGESHEDGALREVEEETGLRCRLVKFLDNVRYRDRSGKTKVVRYWVMVSEGGRFVPGEEVDELRWVALDAAVVELTYEHDRQIVSSFVRDSDVTT